MNSPCAGRRCARLGLADLLGLLCTLDFRRLAHPRLTEHRQRNDPLFGSEPVRDAYGLAVQFEAQLAQLAAQVA
jgi:hypothetical protein